MFNVFSVWIVVDLGFGVLYLSGVGVINMLFGLLDFGFVGFGELVEYIVCVCDVVDLLLMVDVDIGFGNVLNVLYMVCMFECSGVDVI